MIETIGWCIPFAIGAVVAFAGVLIGAMIQKGGAK